MNLDLKWTENLALLADNMRHLRLELSFDKPNWFRIGKEAYHVLSRTMVEALRGSANLAITGSRRQKNRRVYYQLGDMTWKMVERTPIAGCEVAWRFSDPIPQKPPEKESEAKGRVQNDKIVGFYELLAMIQSEYFMSRLVGAKPIAVSNGDVKSIEWLHEAIRNEFEHFMPKLYGAGLNDLKQGTKVALDLSYRLFTQSGNIMLIDEHEALLSVLRITRRFLEAVGT